MSFEIEKLCMECFQVTKERSNFSKKHYFVMTSKLVEIVKEMKRSNSLWPFAFGNFSLFFCSALNQSSSCMVKDWKPMWNPHWPPGQSWWCMLKCPFRIKMLSFFPDLNSSAPLLLCVFTLDRLILYLYGKPPSKEMRSVAWSLNVRDCML